MQYPNFLLRKILGVDEAVTGPLRGRNQLIQFQVQYQRILVLRPLNEEHHQKRDDGGAGVDDQLPRFGILK